METLLLLRHAKAGDKDAASDHDRPLTDAGLGAARRLGEWLRERCLRPDHVLCSSSRRTRETLEALGLSEGAAELERDLYLASAGALLDRLGEVPDDRRTVLLVGHNPGIADLAEWLTGEGDERARKRLRKGFPPAALAQLAIGGAPRPAAGRLDALVKPKDLDPER